jgi:hypothetical protein
MTILHRRTLVKKDRLASVFIVILVIIVLTVSGFAVRYFLQMLPAQVAVEPPSGLLPQPNPTIYPNAATIIESVQELSRLETASYVMEKVITAESGQGPLSFIFGDRLLLIAHGEVIAGIDLADFGPDDLAWGEGGTLYVRLPEPSILVTTLDNERTQVYDRQTGLVGLNEQLEAEARQEAENLIEEAALNQGILDRAEKNARVFLRSLLRSIGAKHVVFAQVLPTPVSSPTPVSE